MRSSRSRRLISALLAIPLALGAWMAFHLELLESLPAEDQVLEEAPETVWLKFSAVPDMERTSFSIRGPDGAVKLGEVSAGDEAEIIRAEVMSEMPAGSYTLSWVGAPLDDHTVRGRFEFTIAGAR